MFIDSHAHLDDPKFEPDFREALDRASKAKVEKVLVIGNGVASSKIDSAISIAKKAQWLDVAAGIHPHDAGTVTGDNYIELTRFAQEEKLVAWGEIGLDFHYNYSDPEVQKEVFIQQLLLAKKSSLPVIIHTREAETETLKILSEHYADSRRQGIMHCYSGSLSMAECCLEMGFYISFSGILTFPKAHEIRRIAEMVPLDKLLIETDAPYLAPVPYRGKRNEPAFLVEIAKILASIRNVDIETIARCTRENYFRVICRK